MQGEGERRGGTICGSVGLVRHPPDQMGGFRLWAGEVESALLSTWTSP